MFVYFDNSRSMLHSTAKEDEQSERGRKHTINLFVVDAFSFVPPFSAPFLEKLQKKKKNLNIIQYS